MKLLLHIGTEKTGSSYLQSLLANNREQLLENGIHFPSAGKRENDMIQGKISPGNGQELTNSLLAGNKAETGDLLRKHIQEAKNLDCEKVLISNELLVSAFSEENQWEMFADVAEQTGFTDLHLLLFLREPNEQALSLYKHRAKNGTALSIEEWIREGYHLHHHLTGFFNNIQKYKLKCNIRKHQKDAGYIEGILFNEWLGLENPQKKVNKTVNPSLSISELFIIKKIRNYDTELTREFYKRLVAVPIDEKAKDERIENYYLNVIGDHLAQHKKLWNHCNSLLPAGEKLTLSGTVPLNKNDRAPEKVVSLSERQVEVIAELMADALGPSLRWKLKRQSVRKELGKLKAKLLNR